MTVDKLIEQLQHLQSQGYGSALVSLRYLDVNYVDRERDVNYVFMDGNGVTPIAVVSEVGPCE